VLISRKGYPPHVAAGNSGMKLLVVTWQLEYDKIIQGLCHELFVNCDYGSSHHLLVISAGDHESVGRIIIGQC
jgi:hypothetical protein